MTQRSKNLLEAFNDSSRVEKTREAKPAKQRRSTANVGGPFAPEARAREKAPKPKPVREVSRPDFTKLVSANPAARAFLRNALPVYLGIALVFFLIGRASVQRVDAAPQDPGAAAADSSQVPGAVAASAPVGGESNPAGEVPQASPGPAPLPAVNALHDRANKWTILASQYALTESAQKLGWNAYAHLKEAGFPVFPLYRGERKYQLFVGASGEQAELDELLAEIRQLPGPSGRKGDFATTMVVMIDTYVKRD